MRARRLRVLGVQQAWRFEAADLEELYRQAPALAVSPNGNMGLYAAAEFPHPQHARRRFAAADSEEPYRQARTSARAQARARAHTHTHRQTDRHTDARSHVRHP